MGISARRAELKQNIARNAKAIEAHVAENTSWFRLVNPGTPHQADLKRQSYQLAKITNGDKSKQLEHAERAAQAAAGSDNPLLPREQIDALVHDVREYRNYQTMPSYKVAKASAKAGACAGAALGGVVGAAGCCLITGPAVGGGAGAVAGVFTGSWLGVALSAPVTLPMAGIERMRGKAKSGDPIAPLRVPRDQASRVSYSLKKALD